MGRSGVERGNTHHSNRGRVCCPPVGCSEVSSLSPINSHHSTFIHHHSNFWVGRCVVGGLSAGVGETRTIATREMRTIATKDARRPKTSTIATREMCTIATRAGARAWWLALRWGGRWRTSSPPSLWSSLGTARQLLPKSGTPSDAFWTNSHW